MATIKVNSTVMRDKASSFRTVAKSINTYTTEMTTEVESLKSVWEGESAETTVTNFKKLSEKFENIFTSINNYADFLDQAAERYDKAESANVEGAQGE